MTGYLDHNATTPLDPRVLEAMLPYLQTYYGNPSSTHAWGRTARQALDTAREQVAALVNVHPTQVVFTSGGTEANNLALKGLAGRQLRGSLAVSAIEHPSVLEAARALARQGWRMETIPVDSLGRVTSEAVQSRLRPEGRFVSVMLANNETGVIQDIARIAQIVRGAGLVMHTDAVQAAGKLPLDFGALAVDLLSLSAHKIGGPKGAGALVVDKALDMEPVLHGGGHESGRRAGTENVAGIVGFGMAAELAGLELDTRREHMKRLRGRLEDGLAALPGVMVFAQAADRLPNTTYMAVAGIQGETLLMNLDLAGFGVSSGSACSAAEPDVSHVLRAMGVNSEQARGAIRISLGTNNTAADIDAFLDALRAQIMGLRHMAAGVLAR